MRLEELEDKMVLSQIAWFVCLHYIHRDELWKGAYEDFEDYAHRRWGVGIRAAQHWASYGEILIVLEPALDLEAAPTETEVEAGGEQLVRRPLGLGSGGVAIAPGRLRPLISLRRIGWPDEEVREVWRRIMAHTTEPTAKRVHEAVIEEKKEALQGRRSAAGASAFREMLALHVYNLIRYETESDEIAVRCRSAILTTLKRLAFENGDDEGDTEEEEMGGGGTRWTARRPGERSEY